MTQLNLYEREAAARIKAILRAHGKSKGKAILEQVDNELFKGIKANSQTARKLSNFQLDRELTDFLVSLDLEHMTQKEALKRCVERFGEDRTPKRSAFSRNWSWIKSKKSEQQK